MGRRRGGKGKGKRGKKEKRGKKIEYGKRKNQYIFFEYKIDFKFIFTYNIIYIPLMDDFKIESQNIS